MIPHLGEVALLVATNSRDEACLRRKSILDLGQIIRCRCAGDDTLGLQPLERRKLLLFQKDVLVLCYSRPSSQAYLVELNRLADVGGKLGEWLTRRLFEALRLERADARSVLVVFVLPELFISAVVIDPVL